MSEKELYDLSSDIGESGGRNLYATNRSVAAELETVLIHWLKSVDAAMPTAIRRSNRQGTDHQWYSSWLLKQNPIPSENDSFQEAINDAKSGDTITVFPSRIGESVESPPGLHPVSIETAY